MSKDVKTFNWSKGKIQIDTTNRTLMEMRPVELHHKENGSKTLDDSGVSIDAPSFAFVFTRPDQKEAIV